MPTAKVACGRFLKPFGVGGELKFEPYFPDDVDPANLLTGVVRFGAAAGRPEREIIIASARPLAGGLWALRPDGCGSPEEAALFTNAELWVDRSQVALEEGEYLAQDIIGCAVRDAATGTEIGTVRDVLPTGANDVWEVKAPDGRDILIPAIGDVIASVDVKGRVITINVIDGLLD